MWLHGKCKCSPILVLGVSWFTLSTCREMKKCWEGGGGGIGRGGPWISSSTKKSGNGASQSFVQETVGKGLGFVSVVNVFDNPVLTEEECTLITVALEHRQLVRDYPITHSEVMGITIERLEMMQNLSTSERQQILGGTDEEQESCKCVVHTNTSEIEPTLLAVLRNIMTCSSELGGDFQSGNLTNLTLHLLTIGVVGSIGFDDPEVQLAIGTLGMLAKRRTTMISALLMKRNFDCYI